MTARQARLLAFIQARLAESPVSPSFQEMAEHMGLSSKSGIWRLVDELAKQGRIIRSPHKARSISLPTPEKLTFTETRIALAEIARICSKAQRGFVPFTVAVRQIQMICGERT